MIKKDNLLGQYILWVQCRQWYVLSYF